MIKAFETYFSPEEKERNDEKKEESVLRPDGQCQTKEVTTVTQVEKTRLSSNTGKPDEALKTKKDERRKKRKELKQ
jgi:hypothetical protein